MPYPNPLYAFLLNSAFDGGNFRNSKRRIKSIGIGIVIKLAFDKILIFFLFPFPFFHVYPPLGFLTIKITATVRPRTKIIKPIRDNPPAIAEVFISVRGSEMENGLLGMSFFPKVSWRNLIICWKSVNCSSAGFSGVSSGCGSGCTTDSPPPPLGGALLAIEGPMLYVKSGEVMFTPAVLLAQYE